MNWLERFLVWYEWQLRRLPRWAGHTTYLLLWPILGVILIAYSVVALIIFLLFVLPFRIVFGTAKRWGAEFTQADVREHAKKLDAWFSEQLGHSTEGSDFFGAGPELVRELVRLVDEPEIMREAAEQFSERIERELKGYKGSPFFALKDLSHRLVDLTSRQTGTSNREL